MKLTLSELIAKVTGLESRAEAAFKTELADLRAQITGQLTQLQADLTAANTAKNVLEQGKVDADAKVSELTGKLSEQNKLFLDGTAMLRDHMAKVDASFAPTGPKKDASLTDLITAEINATNTALAKTGVDISKLPASPATGGANAAAAPKKFKSVDEEIAYVKAQAAKV